MLEAQPGAIDPTVEAARDGDLAAFEALVREHADAVFGHALRFFGDRATAEDATQEVLLKMYRSLRTFDGRARFSTWLFRLTRNVCIDIIRRSPAKVIPTDPLDLAPPPAPDFADGVIAAASLESAMASLPPEDRDALNAVTLFGLSYVEAGAALGVPTGTVKSRVFRARRALLTLLGLTRESG